MFLIIEINHNLFYFLIIFLNLSKNILRINTNLINDKLNNKSEDFFNSFCYKNV